VTESGCDVKTRTGDWLGFRPATLNIVRNALGALWGNASWVGPWLIWGSTVTCQAMGAKRYSGVTACYWFRAAPDAEILRMGKDIEQTFCRPVERSFPRPVAIQSRLAEGTAGTLGRLFRVGW